MRITVRVISVLPVVLALAGCDGSSAATPPAASALASAQTATQTSAQASAHPKKAGPPTLAETPASKLGTSPEGFGLAAGAKAPDATLPDITGKSQSLASLYAEGPTFVVFYRGGWCPFCNLQLHALAKAKPDFEAKSLRVVSISVDRPDEQAKTQAKNGVPFPMLSDADLAVHKAFHVVHVPGEAESKALAGHGVDLEKYSGQTHHSFAVPSIFLVDRAGVIRWSHVDEDYKTRPTPKQMLEAAEKALTR